MIGKYFIVLMCVFTESCKGQKVLVESDEATNARWYYYSYAAELKAYDRSGTEVPPLLCDVKLSRVVERGDTTSIFFIPFLSDSSNTSSFKPLDLVGVNVVRSKFYLPIYHAIAFDAESESSILERMRMQDLLLRKKISDNKSNINAWLMREADNRK